MLTRVVATNRLATSVHLGVYKNALGSRLARKFRYVDSRVGDFYTPVAPEHMEGLTR